MRMRQLLLTMLLITGVATGGVLPAPATDPLRAGAGVADITPENGRNFFGYVRPDIAADGVALRLFAHALVLARGENKLALISIDHGAALDKESLVARLADRGYDHRTVLFTATHSHAGPDVAGGFDDFALEQIAQAVRDADDALQPARLGWGDAELHDASVNRSLEAHLANHGLDLIKGQGKVWLDPDGEEHTIDPVLSVLRVESVEGKPIAALANFSAHPTTFVPANHFYSADYPGVGARRFAAGFDDEPPVVLFTMRGHGDQSARFDEFNQHAVADRTGQRVATAMAHAWEHAEEVLTDQAVLDARWGSVPFGTDAAPDEPTSPYPFWGLSFFGGSEDGASIFYEPIQTEGRRRPAELADDVHGRKIVVAPTAQEPITALYDTEPEIQVARVGDRLLLGVPGEATAEMGRRLRAAALAVAPDGVTDAMPVGLANDFVGYFTTPEEYDQQHYEGGHTPFGKWSSNLLRAALVGLVEAFGSDPVAAPAGSGSTAPGSPWTGDGGVAGELVGSPLDPVERMRAFDVTWTGAEDGLDRPLGSPFLVLERMEDDDWEVVDSDLGHRWAWRQDGDTYTARYDVEPEWPAGTYRVRVLSGSYELTTDPFEITPSTGLIVRGATLEEQGPDTLVRFVAQNPPPDPARNLLARDHAPKGGTLTFVFDGTTYEAMWNGPGRGWTAAVPGIAVGDTVELPAGALVDKHGNTSGEATTLTIGEVAPLVWPASIGPGDGRTPGFGGEGHFPP